MLNRLRTAYVHLPPPARNVLSRVLALVPIRYRYGRTYFQYRAFIARADTDPDFVARWRRQHLGALLEAARRSRYWSAVLEANGLAGASVEAFEAGLERLPILTKDDVRAHLTDLLSRPASSLDQVSTSGSSGTPLVTYLDRGRSAKEWAFVQASWARAGFAPDDVRAVFRGIHLGDVDAKPWEFEPSLRELRLSPFHLTDAWMQRYCALIRQHRATFLHGYPSAIGIFSNFVLRTDQRADQRAVREQVRGVLCASEALLPHQRELMARAFPNARITSFYGMSEKVLFASGDPDDPGAFDMSPLYGVAELVDDEGRRVVEPGRRGRIVGSGLLFHGMPLIRYDTGDAATLVEPATERNGFRMRVRDIVGRRSQEFLVGRGGELISMTAINIHSPAYARMRAFQFSQTEPGRAVLNVVPAPGCAREDVQPFLDEISAKIGASLSFEIVVTDALRQNSRGKTKFIEQKIDLSSYQ